LGTGINPPLIPSNSKKRPSCKRSDDIVGGLVEKWALLYPGRRSDDIVGLAEKWVLLYPGECVYRGVGGLAEIGVVVCLGECVYSGGLTSDIVSPCILGDGAGGLAEIGVVCLGECVYSGGLTLDIVTPVKETPGILGDGVESRGALDEGGHAVEGAVYGGGYVGEGDLCGG